MSSLTLEQIEQDIKKLNKDLGNLRWYVSSHRDEICSIATTNQLNKQLGKYLPNGYAFKRNYNVLGIRAVSGRNKQNEEIEEETPKKTRQTKTSQKKSEQPPNVQKRPRRIIKPSDLSDSSSEEIVYQQEQQTRPKTRQIKERPRRQIQYEEEEDEEIEIQPPKRIMKSKPRKTQQYYADDEDDEEEEIKAPPKQKAIKQTPIEYETQQPVRRKPMSNKNIARSIFQEKARRLYHNL